MFPLILNSQHDFQKTDLFEEYVSNKTLSHVTYILSSNLLMEKNNSQTADTLYLKEKGNLNLRIASIFQS